MYIWASLARHAKYARLSRVLGVFLIIQCLLALPVGFTFLRDPPALFYPRVHGGPFFEFFDGSQQWGIIEGDENGFVRFISPAEGVTWPVVFANDDYERHMSYSVKIAPRYEYVTGDTDFNFVITPEYIFYQDSNAMLAVPTRLVPVWVLEEMDFMELFNHLALYNRYFSSVVAPVFVLVFFVIFISQLLIYVAAVWLFGQWQKLSGNMTIRERFAVCTFASVPAVILGVAFGFFLPIMHLLIFQLLMIYCTYRAMKEFLNA